MQAQLPEPTDHAGNSPTARVVVACLLVAALLLILGLLWNRDGPENAMPWDELVAAEEAIIELGPALESLGEALENLRLPDPSARGLFAGNVEVVDLAERGEARARPLGALDASYAPARGRARTIPRSELDLWRGFLEGIDLFEHAALRVVRGELAGGPPARLRTELAFAGASRRAGRTEWTRGRLEVTWEADGEAAGGAVRSWRIVSWLSGGLRTLSVERPLFSDVLEEATAPADAMRARRSIHEEHVLELLLRRQGAPTTSPARPLPHPLFQLPAFDRHPGVSVCDIDGDGHDDLYIMARWGPNLLFRNRGDGTFEEVAASFGLDVAEHTSCALFVDLDNDGDLDAVLGRTLAPSLYLVNEDGRFVDRSAELVEGPLPAFVSSLSATDLDADGLLDVYCSTYAASVTNDEPVEAWAPLLSGPDARELERLRATPDHHAILNRFGPPNILLKNLGGGRLAPAESGALRVFANTYQAGWADYDDDGDADVYLANDFAPNHLFRNDGAGAFTDVTAETGTADLGFGMGVSWGDYDGDGRFDLYVSNMFSKAGRRITQALSDLDPRFAGMARGNTLFRNGARGFEHASGLEPPSLLVEAAGWSWGGQFIDLDNDTDLDLVALSGYYTAPDVVEQPVDI
ncbi:MAG: VCBS repeat-containing protein [Planctomycetota bacterium]|jgi:hypothetical protein|nr:VCBS repeat-containing protein [Planctomycetota bacterium]MDP6763657.1 VCBS repeat-containing protein [Planctomycetota bacterium]MDP6987926.1 VCBS repeat-containing protein [Planctomycetota bacterium]